MLSFVEELEQYRPQSATALPLDLIMKDLKRIYFTTERGQLGTLLKKIYDEMYEAEPPKVLIRAFMLASMYHIGDNRQGERPYVQHPLMLWVLVCYVFKDLVDEHMFLIIQCIALLHDVIEDGPKNSEYSYTAEQIFAHIKQDIGEEVAQGVQNLTNRREKFEAAGGKILWQVKHLRTRQWWEVTIKALDKVLNNPYFPYDLRHTNPKGWDLKDVSEKFNTVWMFVRLHDDVPESVLHVFFKTVDMSEAYHAEKTARENA